MAQQDPEAPARVAPWTHAAQCQATNKQGLDCTRPAVPGATVCRYHGGAAPQVQRKAKLRLLELVDPAIATLAREMASAEKSADKQRAANSILDRAGFGRVTKIENADARELLRDKLIELRDQARTLTGEVEADEGAPGAAEDSPGRDRGTGPGLPDEEELR